MQRSTRRVRSFAAGRFALSIDGSSAGFIKKVSGGTIKGEIVAHNLGVSNVKKKHLATISHEPVTLEVGMGMGKPLWDWIEASFDKGFVTKNCEVVAADFNYKEMATREFQDAFISEFTVPTLDGSNKDTGYFTIQVTPKTIRYTKGTGSPLKTEESVLSKQWLCSNFRLEIGDLPCDRVSKIDSITWQQKVASEQIGQFHEPDLLPSSLEIPNLKLTVSMADIGPWQEWHQAFVIDGKCTDGDELTGSIEFLGPDLQETLATLELAQVGIISLEPDSEDADNGGPAGFEVELYVEEIKFKYGG